MLVVVIEGGDDRAHGGNQRQDEQRQPRSRPPIDGEVQREGAKHEGEWTPVRGVAKQAAAGRAFTHGRAPHSATHARLQTNIAQMRLFPFACCFLAGSRAPKAGSEGTTGRDRPHPAAPNARRTQPRSHMWPGSLSNRGLQAWAMATRAGGPLTESRHNPKASTMVAARRPGITVYASLARTRAAAAKNDGTIRRGGRQRRPRFGLVSSSSFARCDATAMCSRASSRAGARRRLANG